MNVTKSGKKTKAIQPAEKARISAADRCSFSAILQGLEDIEIPALHLGGDGALGFCHAPAWRMCPPPYADGPWRIPLLVPVTFEIPKSTARQLVAFRVARYCQRVPALHWLNIGIDAAEKLASAEARYHADGPSLGSFEAIDRRAEELGRECDQILRDRQTVFGSLSKTEIERLIAESGATHTATSPSYSYDEPEHWAYEIIDVFKDSFDRLRKGMVDAHNAEVEAAKARIREFRNPSGNEALVDRGEEVETHIIDKLKECGIQRPPDAAHGRCILKHWLNNTLNAELQKTVFDVRIDARRELPRMLTEIGCRPIRNRSEFDERFWKTIGIEDSMLHLDQARHEWTELDESQAWWGQKGCQDKDGNPKEYFESEEVFLRETLVMRGILGIVKKSPQYQSLARTESLTCGKATVTISSLAVGTGNPASEQNAMSPVPVFDTQMENPAGVEDKTNRSPKPHTAAKSERGEPPGSGTWIPPGIIIGIHPGHWKSFEQICLELGKNGHEFSRSDVAKKAADSQLPSDLKTAGNFCKAALRNGKLESNEKSKHPGDTTFYRLK